MRDLTQKQFEEALKRHSIKKGLFGYYKITSKCLVYAKNGGDSKRAQIAYLIKEQKRQEKQNENQ